MFFFDGTTYHSHLNKNKLYFKIVSSIEFQMNSIQKETINAVAQWVPFVEVEKLQNKMNTTIGPELIEISPAI